MPITVPRGQTLERGSEFSDLDAALSERNTEFSALEKPFRAQYRVQCA